MNTSKTIGNNIVYLTEISSTNIYASQLIKENKAEEGTVIIAKKQTSGKGQAKNKWESEDGKNLTISIILSPIFLPVDKQFFLSKTVSLAIIDFLRELSIDNLFIKWPNDIYVGKQKIAGILIENSILGGKYVNVVIGIGLNINQTQFSREIPNPVSLKLLSNKQYNIDDCLNILLNKIEARYEQLKSLKYSIIDNEYLNVLLNFNVWANYLYNYMTITAKVVGINKYGKLLLERKDNAIIECDLKEIKFII